MKLLFLNLTKLLIGIPLIIISTIIMYFSTDLSFILSLLLATVSVSTLYFLISTATNFYVVKKHNLTLKEYLFIKKNLRDANKKMKRLYKSLLSIHHLSSLKQRIQLIRVMRKIFKITNKHPQRFYKAERFYYSHLDSVVEILEKFVFLSSQPKKNHDITLALNETEKTLGKLSKMIEKDLYSVVSDDLNDLKFEIDVANYSTKRRTNSFFERE